MFAKTKDILAIIQDVEDKTVDNRVNHECLEASTSKSLSLIKKAIQESAGNFEQIEEKHNGFVDKVGDAIEELSDKVEALQRKIKNLDKWDDETRSKFAALEKYLGVDIVPPSSSNAWTVEERTEEINYSPQDSN